jgi:hypothetical protein
MGDDALCYLAVGTRAERRRLRLIEAVGLIGNGCATFGKDAFEFGLGDRRCRPGGVGEV